MVDHIHLQFEKGMFNAILGPNGGKGNQRLRNKIIDSIIYGSSYLREKDELPVTKI